MSNAKVRHRRRWYREQRRAEVARVEAELEARGYVLSGTTGAERVWVWRLPEEARVGQERVYALQMEWVEVP